jgi:Flp pilus assembly pilin Flp
MSKWMQIFLADDDGTTAVEYAVMLALILAGIIASVSSVGVGTGGLYSNNSSALQSAGLGS